jgi:hypothetical protein
MGLWGVLLEIARAVVPHAAPHVARAVADAAKERRAASEAARTRPSAEDLAGALSYLDQRLAAVEEKAATAEQRLSLAEAERTEERAIARKWFIGFIVWSALVTAALIYVIIVLARK